MLLIGIDDAGRGPLIGPMVLAGVLLDATKESNLKSMGAKDSKILSHPERVRLSALIKKEVKKSVVVLATPEEIDKAVETVNLNTLEAQKMAEVINQLNDGKTKTRVIVDCPSINTVKWREKLISFIEETKNLEVVCEHKADANHPSVSAASILAKVEREEQVAAIKSQYGDIGSGYPADPYTKQFLKEHGTALKDAGIFRKSWATWKEMFPQYNTSKKNKTLLDY
jgi:ribonuclease HII